MKIDLYCVYDTVANQYGMPFPAQNDNVAVRMFIDDCSRPDQFTAMQTHPGDFCLYKVGALDTDTGQLTAPAQPQFLTRGAAQGQLVTESASA